MSQKYYIRHLLIHGASRDDELNVFVQLLLEEYDEDSELNYLINNREIWFIPVVNPDGYVYNELIEPNGGGMHRKNRLDTNCGNGDNRALT